MLILRHLLAVGLLFLTSTALASPPVEGQPLTSFDAINVAARQRMLSQRVVKLYCQQALGIRSNAALHNLQEAVELFDQQLAALRSVSKSQELQHALQLEAKAWGDMKPLLSQGTPSREGAKHLDDKGDEVLEAAQKHVVLLVKQSRQKGFDWIELAGKQRMLIQQMAKLYLLRQLGVSGGDHGASLEKAKTEFMRSQEVLLKAAQNDPELLDALSAVDRQWRLLKPALGGNGKSEQEAVAVVSDRMLEAMEKAASMFEEAYDLED